METVAPTDVLPRFWFIYTNYCKNYLMALGQLTLMPHIACQIGRDVAVPWAWLVIDKHVALRPPADRSH